jgi:hypothetical protein
MLSACQSEPGALAPAAQAHAGATPPFSSVPVNRQKTDAFRTLPLFESRFLLSVSVEARASTASCRSRLWGDLRSGRARPRCGGATAPSRRPGRREPTASRVRRPAWVDVSAPRPRRWSSGASARVRSRLPAAFRCAWSAKKGLPVHLRPDVDEGDVLGLGHRLEDVDHQRVAAGDPPAVKGALGSCARSSDDGRAAAGSTRLRPPASS